MIAGHHMQEAAPRATNSRHTDAAIVSLPILLSGSSSDEVNCHGDDQVNTALDTSVEAARLEPLSVGCWKPGASEQARNPHGPGAERVPRQAFVP
jgi:hypothetical protein